MDSQGNLNRLEMTGHAPGTREGVNFACAAITLVARTTCRLICSQTLQWEVESLGENSGQLFLEIKQYPDEKILWLKGVTDTLLGALFDISREYPETLLVNIEEKR